MVEHNRVDRRKSAAGARARAAKSLFAAAGLTVEPVDEHHWRVTIGEGGLLRDEPPAPRPGYLFWPATGLWRRPDGSAGGFGARTLIAAIRTMV